MALKVVHYLSTIRLADGGVARSVLDLCDALASHNTHVTLASADATDVPIDWKSQEGTHPTILELDRRLTWKRRIDKASLPKLVSAIASANVVHLHTPWCPANVQIASICDKLRKPYVLTSHGMLDRWPMRQKWLKKRLYLSLAGRSLLHGAARVHFTAEDEQRQSIRWATRMKSAIIPYVFDLTPFRNLPSKSIAIEQFAALSHAGLKLLFLSRVHPKKGVEKLIDAASEMSKQGRTFQVLVAGPGEPKYISALKAKARSLGLADAVHFLGMVRDDVKLSLYNAADVFVLPTSQENFGLVLLEAMACGLPVITTRGVDIWRELQEGGAEIVDNENSISPALSALCDLDSESLASIGAKSRQWVMDTHDATSTIGRYISMYSQVAER